MSYRTPRYYADMVTRVSKSFAKKKVSKSVPKPVKKYVKKVVKGSGDRQYIDYTNASGTAIGPSIGNGGLTAPITYELSRVPSGDGIEQKAGSRIHVTGLRIKGILDQAAVAESNIVRCLVFQLKDPPNYSGRTSNVLLQKLFGSASTTADFLYNPVVPHEATIFWDKTWIMTGSRDPTNLVEKRLVDKWVKINRTIFYTKDGATAGFNEARNPLFIIWISDSSIVPNPGFSGGLVRMYYRD